MRRATVLQVNSDESRPLDADAVRPRGLIVTDADPESAVTMLDALAPDVVLTEFVFPGRAVYGPAFIRMLRQRVGPFTSIIVVSRYAREEDREGARRAGADAYLIKPASERDVLRKVRAALTLRRRGRRLPWNWRTGQLAALNTDLGRRHRLAVDAVERTPSEEPVRPGRRRAHILLVEDDASIREMMVMLLESAGFAVMPMVDGADALAYLKEGGRANVVVLDLMMPRVDGWTFRRAQLADPAIADIPVIVVTAYAGSSTSELHAAATFEKPVDVAQVIDAVRQLAG